MKNKTKILLVVVSVVILLAGIATISYSYRGRGHGRGYGMRQGFGARGGMGLGILQFHSDSTLRLTDEQNAKIDKIRLAGIEKRWQLRREFLKLQQANAGAEKIEALRKQMNEHREKIWKEIEAVLTDKQKQEITRFRSEGRNSYHRGYRRGNHSGDCPYQRGGGYHRGQGRGYGRGNW